MILNIQQKPKKQIDNNNSDKTYSKLNYTKIKQLAIDTNWREIVNITDPEEATNSLTNKISEIIRSSTTKIFCTKKYKKIKPWITIGIINSIKKRDNMKN